MKRLNKTVAALLLGGGTIGGWFFGANVLQNARWAHAEQQREATQQQISHLEDMANVFRDVGKVVEPSVVQIGVHKTLAGGGRKPMPFDDDMLRRFFDRRNNNNNNNEGDTPQDSPDETTPDEGMEQVGTGSGVIMEVDGNTGYILTNNHVAGGATEMVVTLNDSRRITNAKLLGADAKSDLAVIKIEADHLVAAKWGDSDKLAKGDWIMAFGSPFGYIGSMTHGIVSALNRQAGILGQYGYENFIQVDAPINPGNSGGPLVNLHGEVVGINTAIASRSGGFQGIGFAIPSDQAKYVYNALKTKGKVTRGWLGVGITDVGRDLALAKSFGYNGNNGVLVMQTFENTPASGKLQNGDIITKIDGKSVETVQQLRNQIASTSPGQDVHLTVFRKGHEEDVTLKIGEQPENPAVAAGRGSSRGGSQGQSDATSDALGMRLATPTDELIQKYGLTEKSGALVLSVQPRSAAAKAGIRPGDLITQVGTQDVRNAKDAQAAITKQDAKKGIRFYVTSAEGARFVLVEPQQ